MSSNPTDYDALAQRYLDLWQQEMAKLAQDPTAAGSWANLFQGMMQNATAAWPTPMTAGGAATKSNTPHGSAATSTTQTGATQTRASTSSAASGDGGLAAADVLRRIDARLDSIEQRLTALEQRALEAAQAPRSRAKSKKP